MSSLIDTIKASTSPFHAAAEVIRQLKQADFVELDINSDWDLCLGRSYYICPFGTTVIAFTINNEFDRSDMLRIATAHIDSPGPRIKANPVVSRAGVALLNTEIYGGAILNTFMDRPLSMAGRLYTKGSRIGNPVCHLIDFKKPVAIIPNLPIHMNRKVNEGAALNEQTDMQPIVGLDGTVPDYEALLANEAGVDRSDILSWEMCLYNCEEGRYVGFNDELLAAPRIDNISSVVACLEGIINGNRMDGIDMIALFDHEEVGSRTKNGGASQLLANICERIYDCLGLTRADYLRSVTSGLMLSLDVAHATHPAHPERYDTTSAINLGGGVALKTASKQNYTNDGEIHGIIKALCQANNIPVQTTYLRSDQPGGSTLAAALTCTMPMRCADLGVPILAMHSACETMALSDQEALEKLMREFFSM